MIDEALDIIYHPGADITVRGFFLKNTVADIKVKLTYSLDNSIVIYTSICLEIDPNTLTCQTPLIFIDYGEYYVSLVEALSNV